MLGDQFCTHPGRLAASGPPEIPFEESHARCSCSTLVHTHVHHWCIPLYTLADSPCPCLPAAAAAINRKCKEVKCKKMSFKDGYGAALDRNGACFDDQASVVVTITDSCPCHYPGNQYSNKRWCCG